MGQNNYRQWVLPLLSNSVHIQKDHPLRVINFLISAQEPAQAMRGFPQVSGPLQRNLYKIGF